MLLSAVGADGLEDLRRLVSAWEAVARQCDLAFDEAVRLATHRLEVERALGDELARTVSRGGSGSRSPERTSKRGGATHGLPDGVTKQNAKRYRDLAMVPDDVFRSYVDYSRSQGKLPSNSGARRFASSHERAVRSYKDRSRLRVPAIELSGSLIEVLGQIMVPDLVVCEPRLAGGRHVSDADSLQPEDIEGDVFAVEREDPARLLRQIQQRREAGAVRRAIVVVKAEVWADWFEAALRSGWACSFVQGLLVDGVGVAVLHHDEHHHAFRAAMARCERSCSLAWTTGQQK